MNKQAIFTAIVAATMFQARLDPRPWNRSQPDSTNNGAAVKIQELCTPNSEARSDAGARAERFTLNRRPAAQRVSPASRYFRSRLSAKPSQAPRPTNPAQRRKIP